MSDKVIIRSAYKDNKNFTEIPDLRRGVIEQAPETPIMANYGENALANLMHPQVQHLKIKQAEALSKDLNAFVLVPDTEKGTAKLSQFKAGQQIEISIAINDEIYTRDFTICSSPARAFNDEYVIIINGNTEDKIIKYIINNWKPGTPVTASSPNGYFYHQALRDPFHIMGICNNSGITPFLAMAEAICDGSLKADLTLLYSARKQRDIAMFDHLNELSHNCKRFNVVYVFSDEHVFKSERGFITKSLIEKHKPNNKFSLFINGDYELYSKIIPQINDLNLKNGALRLGPQCNEFNVTSYNDFPREKADLIFLCKIYKNKEYVATVPCSSSESLYLSFEKEGLIKNFDNTEYMFLITEGETFIPEDKDSRKSAEKKRNIANLKNTYPLSNLSIEIK